MKVPNKSNQIGTNIVIGRSPVQVGEESTSSIAEDSSMLESEGTGDSWLQTMTAQNFGRERKRRGVTWTAKEQATIRHIATNEWTKRNARKEIEMTVNNEKSGRIIDFEEGVFIFQRKPIGTKCYEIQLPVDEQVYLKRHKDWDLRTYLHERESNKTGEIRNSTAFAAWSFAQKIIICEANSLNLFHHTSKFRRIMVFIVESKPFDITSIILILLNSLVLASYNYEDRKNETPYNKNLHTVNMVFSWFFIVECIFKIIAYGFVSHYNSYLRDKWNWLDFLVVLVSIVEMVGTSYIQLKPLRTLRVLRPLRSIKALPGMRHLILSLIKSLPSLSQTVFFMSIIFTLFGILGIQQYAGVFYQRCRTQMDIVEGRWPMDPENEHLCTLDGSGLYQCPSGMVCGTPQMRGLSILSDRPERQIAINYGMVTFDNIFIGFITIFQMVTLEGWSNIMYDLMDVSMPWLAILMCVSLVFICSFFMLNVILAVIADSISDDGELEDQEAIKKNMAISKSIKYAIKTKREQQSPEVQKRLSVKVVQRKMLQVLQEKKSGSVILQPTNNFQLQLGPDKSNCNQSDLNSEIESVDLSELSCTKSIGRMEKEESETHPLQKHFEQRIERRKSIQLEKSQHNCVTQTAYSCVESPLFNILVILAITGNMVVLAMDRVNESPHEQYILEAVNHTFEWCFFAEMIVKLIGMGFKDYARDRYNLLDAILVIFSMVGMVMKHYGPGEVEGLTSLRGIRLLRVFKLARSWTAFHDLLRWFGTAFKEAGNFVALQSIFVFIFVLMGMEFYAFNVKFDKNEKPGSGLPPRHNFNDLINSLTTIFIVTVGDDWNFVMYDHGRAMDKTYLKNLTIFFFVSMYIMMNLLMLNLLLAILLNSHAQKPNEDDMLEEAEIEEENADIGPIYTYLFLLRYRIQKWFQSMFGRQQQEDDEEEFPFHIDSIPEQENTLMDSRQIVTETSEMVLVKDFLAVEKRRRLSKEVEPLLVLQMQRKVQREKQKKEKAESFEQLKRCQNSKHQYTLPHTKTLDFNKSISIAAIKVSPLTGTSVFLFGQKNTIRLLLQRIVLHPWFDNFILGLIGANMILQILERPLEDPKTPFNTVLKILDEILTGFFLFECIVKVIVWGFACNGENSYLRSGWNVIDFFIAVSSSTAFLQLPTSYEFMKIIRLIRVLKPLRLVNRYPGIRIAVESIIQAVPQFINLQLISVLMLFIFGILGTTFMKGGFNQCHMENVPDSDRKWVKTVWDCFDRGGEWVNRPDNFDNVFNSMLTLFTAVTSEGWASLMWSGVDSNLTNLVPVPGNNRALILYFVFFMMLGSLIVLNLFVGVVVDSNATEKQKIMKTDHMTSLQIEYCDTLTKAYQTRPIAEYVSNNNCFQDRLYQIARSKMFSGSIFVCITLNTICMATTWYGEPSEYKTVMEWLENLFAAIYTLEAILLISVYRHKYFLDSWRIFDFTIVLSAVLGWLSAYLFQVHVGLLSTVLRSFRILRVLKMIKQFKSLHKIINTFVVALPNLVQVGSLLLLFLIIYAELGVYMFSKVKLQEALTGHANFQHFGYALLTLFRMTTGEAWNEIMWDCKRQRSILFQCTYDELDHLQIKQYGTQNCGAGQLASVYFVSFIVICVFIITNMFISVILDGYYTSNEEEKMHINEETIQIFQKIWTKYDPHADGLLKINLLDNLVTDLIFEELKQLKQVKKEADSPLNCLFNLRLNSTLLRQTKLYYELDLGAADMKELKSSKALQRQLKKAFRQWVGRLELPTYRDLKFFNYYDTLTSLIRYSFAVRHAHQDLRRIERIRLSKETGVWLTKWDQMREDSLVFQNLDLIDQEQFLELQLYDFMFVVNRMEFKLQRTGNDQIHKLKVLQEIRQNTNYKYRKDLDRFPKETGYVINSAQVEAARFISQYFQWKIVQKKFKRMNSVVVKGISSKMENRDKKSNKNSVHKDEGKNLIKPDPSSFGKYKSDPHSAVKPKIPPLNIQEDSVYNSQQNGSLPKEEAMKPENRRNSFLKKSNTGEWNSVDDGAGGNRVSEKKPEFSRFQTMAQDEVVVDYAIIQNLTDQLNAIDYDISDVADDRRKESPFKFEKKHCTKGNFYNPMAFDFQQDSSQVIPQSVEPVQKPIAKISMPKIISKQNFQTIYGAHELIQRPKCSKVKMKSPKMKKINKCRFDPLQTQPVSINSRYLSNNPQRKYQMNGDLPRLINSLDRKSSIKGDPTRATFQREQRQASWSPSRVIMQYKIIDHIDNPESQINVTKSPRKPKRQVI